MWDEGKDFGAGLAARKEPVQPPPSTSHHREFSTTRRDVQTPRPSNKIGTPSHRHYLDAGQSLLDPSIPKSPQPFFKSHTSGSITVNRGAQTAFILFSTFLDLRPVSAANDLQTSINGQLEIRISRSKTPD
jgi:hypothetical protein